MDISHNPVKNARNIRVRGLSFDDVIHFDFETALIEIDSRVEYGEIPYVALGKLAERLRVLCFTETETGIRVISFRKTNLREGKSLCQNANH